MQARLKEQEAMLVNSKNFMDILEKKGQVPPSVEKKWKVLRNQRAEAFKQFFETNEMPARATWAKGQSRSKSLFETLDRDLE